MSDLNKSLQDDVNADQAEIVRLMAVRDKQIADITAGFQAQIDKIQKQLAQKSGFIQAAVSAGVDLTKVAIADIAPAPVDEIVL